MYDFLNRHKRAVQIVLALIMLPFMFFGVDFYFRGGASDDVVATVGSQKITRNEFDNALREQGDRMRNAMGGRGYDPPLLLTPTPRLRARVAPRSGGAPRTTATGRPRPRTRP